MYDLGQPLSYNESINEIEVRNESKLSRCNLAATETTLFYRWGINLVSCWSGLVDGEIFIINLETQMFYRNRPQALNIYRSVDGRKLGRL